MRALTAIALVLTLAACADGPQGRPGAQGGDAPASVQSGGSMYVWEGAGTTEWDWCQIVRLDAGESMISAQPLGGDEWQQTQAPNGGPFVQRGRDVGYDNAGGCVWKRYRVFVLAP